MLKTLLILFTFYFLIFTIRVCKKNFLKTEKLEGIDKEFILSRKQFFFKMQKYINIDKIDNILIKNIGIGNVLKSFGQIDIQIAYLSIVVITEEDNISVLKKKNCIMLFKKLKEYRPEFYEKIILLGEVIPFNFKELLEKEMEKQ